MFQVGKWLRLSVKNLEGAVLLESEVFEDRKEWRFLVGYGKSSPHESWACLGLQCEDEWGMSGARLVVPERAVASRAAAVGLVSPVRCRGAAQRPALFTAAESCQVRYEALRFFPNIPRVCQPEEPSS